MLGLAIFEALSQVVGEQTPIPRDIRAEKITPPFVSNIARRLRMSIKATQKRGDTEKGRDALTIASQRRLYHSLPTYHSL
jgi:hypothetical protein